MTGPGPREAGRLHKRLTVSPLSQSTSRDTDRAVRPDAVHASAWTGGLRRALEAILLAPGVGSLVADRPVGVGDAGRVERRSRGDLPEDGEAAGMDVVVAQLTGEHGRRGPQRDLAERERRERRRERVGESTAGE